MLYIIFCTNDCSRIIVKNSSFLLCTYNIYIYIYKIVVPKFYNALNQQIDTDFRPLESLRLFSWEEGGRKNGKSEQEGPFGNNGGVL